MKNDRKIKVGQVRMMYDDNSWEEELYVIDKADNEREGYWHLHFIKSDDGNSSHVWSEEAIQEDIVVM